MYLYKLTQNSLLALFQFAIYANAFTWHRIHASIVTSWWDPLHARVIEWAQIFTALIKVNESENENNPIYTVHR